MQIWPHTPDMSGLVVSSTVTQMHPLQHACCCCCQRCCSCSQEQQLEHTTSGRNTHNNCADFTDTALKSGHWNCETEMAAQIRGFSTWPCQGQSATARVRCVVLAIKFHHHMCFTQDSSLYHCSRNLAGSTQKSAFSSAFAKLMCPSLLRCVLTNPRPPPKMPPLLFDGVGGLPK